MSWLSELQQAEQFYQEHGYVNRRGLPGWDAFVSFVYNDAHFRARLARIERAYCRLVVKVSYATHTELEVLGILQRYQDKRRKLIVRACRYEFTRRNKRSNTALLQHNRA